MCAAIKLTRVVVAEKNRDVGAVVPVWTPRACARTSRFLVDAVVGRVEAIWLKRMKRGPMDPVPRAVLIEGTGLEGNANRGGRRQVTLISSEAWSGVCAALGQPIDPALRRANVLLAGIDLEKTRGR